MTPRIHVDRPLAGGERFVLPTAPSRHVQVLRLQPGAALTLFNGQGGEWRARVATIGRSGVGVEVMDAVDVDREEAYHRQNCTRSSPITCRLRTSPNTCG